MMDLPPNFLRALHRPPALSNAHTPARPVLSNPEPIQQPPALAGEGGGEAQSTGRPLVRFKLCRVRLLDIDAKYTSLKDVLDGLVIARLLPGDREDQIDLECRQEKVATYADERTEIEIEYPNLNPEPTDP